jgi:amino-acid N-acetyltransferase
MFEVNNIAINERHAVQNLLESEGLCFNDVNNIGVQLLEVRSKKAIIGYFGYELYGNYALFRSMVVAPEFRKMGYGKLIWHEAKEKLINEHIDKVFLLTNTASAFFRSQGFVEIARDSVPEDIGSTTEFIEFCPSDSICMMINLTEK